MEWDDVIEELPQSGTPAILRHPPPQFILTNLEAENLGMRSLGVPVPCSRSRDTANEATQLFDASLAKANLHLQLGSP